MKQLTGYLRLMRPANIVTAISDVLGGAAIGHAIFPFSALEVNTLLWPVFATTFLYGGGVVMNDVFDADLDKIERPERPIPSGLIKKSSATIFGILLLLVGILCASVANYLPGIIAAVIALAAVVYDKWAKHHSFMGPLTMGFCRGCNLLLGMSIVGWLNQFLLFAIVPTIYIFAITMISRGEVHGGKRTTLYIAAVLYILVIMCILAISFSAETLPVTLPFIAFFTLMIFVPLQKAINNPEGFRIGKAVKFGVISLIIMNASWAAASNNLPLALLIIGLLPISLLLARLFAVT